jgi:hypothetical protein
LPNSKLVRNLSGVLLLLAATSFISGCALFTPKNFSQFKEGEWQGKVLIHDKKEQRSGVVNLKVKAVDGEQLRLDVTSPIGTHLASILLSGDRLEYLNVADKTVYQSKASKDSLRDILKIPLEPQTLYSVLFDKAMANKNWSCSSDKNGLIAECKDSKSGMDVVWVSREGAKRTIEIQHSSASIQMNLYDFNSKVSDPSKAFQLKVPSSFKVKKI